MEDFQVIKGKIARPYRTILYGTSGIGKTHLASLIPDSIFFDLEEGSGKFDVARLHVNSADDFYQKVAWVASKPEYKTLVIDSLSKLERMLVKKVCAEQGWANLEKPGFGKGPLVLKDEFADVFMKRVNRLNELGKNVVLIAHARTRTFQDPTTEAYDRYEMDAEKGVAAYLISQFDNVYFYRWKLVASEAERGTRYLGKGNGDRELFTQERPSFIAKSRDGLPERIVNPKPEEVFK